MESAPDRAPPPGGARSSPDPRNASMESAEHVPVLAASLRRARTGADRHAAAPGSRVPVRRNVGDRLFRVVTTVFASTLVAVVVSIFVVLAWESSGAVHTFGWGFLGRSVWDPVAKDFGALPFIYGTLVSSLLALLQA